MECVRALCYDARMKALLFGISAGTVAAVTAVALSNFTLPSLRGWLLIIFVLALLGALIWRLFRDRTPRML